MTNQQCVIKIDQMASEILRNGGDEKDLLVGLIECSNDFYKVLRTSSVAEMNMYCEKFPGFFAYAKTLENLAALLAEERQQSTVERSVQSNTQESRGTSTSDRISEKSVALMTELQHIMAKALFDMRDLGSLAGNNPEELVPAIKLFLLSVVSTAADLVEMTVPGSSAYLYAEVEAGVKIGGMRAITKSVQENGPHYSVSGMDKDDLPTAMNYIGQQLIIALTKALHELPLPLRTPETQLRGIETLMANLLHQKFDDPHGILDSLCEHVHMALKQLSEQTENLH